MTSSVSSAVKGFIQQEKLPDSYLETVEQWFIPMTEQILRKVSHSTETLVVGVSGCQGSGKSTLASLLVILLREMIGITSINLSIDDFYLTHQQRQLLAKALHPLFATRGVPGTHDVELAVSTIMALKESGQVAIPRFDKSIDDRSPQSQWPTIQAPVDVIIVEGWCLGIPPQQDDELVNPINDLEREEDQQGFWRQAVNASITGSYLPFYNLVDYLIMLKAPSFEKVFEWRQTQEDKLAALNMDSKDNKVMGKQELRRFIEHYERLTRHGLDTLPEKADIVFKLSDQQTILGTL